MLIFGKGCIYLATFYLLMWCMYKYEVVYMPFLKIPTINSGVRHLLNTGRVGHTSLDKAYMVWKYIIIFSPYLGKKVYKYFSMLFKWRCTQWQVLWSLPFDIFPSKLYFSFDMMWSINIFLFIKYLMIEKFCSICLKKR